MKTLVPLQPIPSLQGNTGYTGQSSGSDSAKSLFTGEVVKDLGNSTFLINVAGKQVEMQSQTQLNVGQQLRLAVTQSNPLELRIVSGDDKIQAQPGQAIQVQPSIAATQLLSSSSIFAAKPINLSSLFTILTGLNPSQTPLSGETITNIANFSSLQYNFLLSPKDSGTILQQLIQHLGLGHERSTQQGQSNIAASQLKNSLFEILATFSRTDQISLEAGKLASIIETFQLANIAHANQNELIFPLPFSFLEQGFLKVLSDNEQTEKESENHEENIRFSLYLGMSKLGNLQIDFNGSSEGIYLHIHTESEQVSSFIESYAYQFIEELRGDTPLLGIRFTEDATSPAASLLQLSTPQENTGLVNTKA